MSSIQEQTYDNPIDFKAIFLDSETADFFFKIIEHDGRSVSVPAHKFLLAARSKTLKWISKMRTEFKIEDVSVDAFKEFLKFFYFDKVKLTMETVSSVLKLGRQFGVIGCMKICEQYLIDTLSNVSLIYTYGLTIEFKLKDLKAQCERKIGANTNDILKSQDFLECSQEVLDKILDIDCFSCSESDVFRACMSWVAQSPGRAIPSKKSVETCLGYLFYKIRFRSMTLEQFAGLIELYGHLFIGDYPEIIQMMATKEFQPVKFCGKLREEYLEDHE